MVSTACAKTVLKKAKITKMDNVVLDLNTHIEFIKAVLKIQGLSDNFSPGVHSGPNFKLWWMGARFVIILLQVLTNPDIISQVGEKVGLCLFKTITNLESCWMLSKRRTRTRPK
jgi:hypothetical protein